MEKLSRALCLGQSSKRSQKEKEIMIAKKIENSLQNWKLPPFSASDVYKRSGIFSSSRIKTVEEEIPLSEGYASFPLLSENLKRAYPKKFDHLHIGMLQVGLKPTKLGSNTTAVIALRGEISRSLHQSLYGMVESSLCDGPIYFSYIPYPNDHYVYLGKDLCSCLSIDVKTEGSCSGDDNIILMYRLHYRVLQRHYEPPRTRDLDRYCVDRKKGETTLLLTNVAQSNRVSSKKICWNEVAVPERWMEWKEYASAHLLQVHVPGFRKEEIKVRVETGGIIRISGEIIREQEEKDDRWRRLEQEKAGMADYLRGGVFLRRLRVPENAKLEEVKAVMESGVLTVMVPKEEINEELNATPVDIIGY